MIRSINESDKKLITEIHSRFYANEFEITELDNLITTFNVDNVCFGGIRSIAEVVLITDKNRTVLDRKKALIEFLQLCSIEAKKNGYKQLHVFVQNGIWRSQLERYDFRPTKGEALVIDL